MSFVSLSWFVGYVWADLEPLSSLLSYFKKDLLHETSHVDLPSAASLETEMNELLEILND